MVVERPEDKLEEPIPLRMNWRKADVVPVHIANQFMLSYTPEGYVLSFGQVMPPAILGDAPDELRDIVELFVNVLGRIAITPDRTKALMLLLERQLKRHSPEILEASAAEEDIE